MSGAIEVNGLLKSYGAHRVLHGLTLRWNGARSSPCWG